ncbi:hypothetical protein SARC_11678 [Sphaeroforma arctica JP610]|uniref:Uncharacterized protein n=1 Tax=Sphaeroforma arctica JP610 TaxID=667725 RepID=A0A0L0FG95_9EUKA|nr:hypothetical protein SARC_11678 [Sphaeroforma arctica JP610]KNC75802.1 hypothetical protein SARC_11678 [Sphaeroforma arctica JP610]|eukprot:XP_014149704.1 hypothetical protein SARC_11678 [Sphaeroforma arctica JP610]
MSESSASAAWRRAVMLTELAEYLVGRNIYATETTLNPQSSAQKALRQAPMKLSMLDAEASDDDGQEWYADGDLDIQPFIQKLTQVNDRLQALKDAEQQEDSDQAARQRVHKRSRTTQQEQSRISQRDSGGDTTVTERQGSPQHSSP